MKRNNFTSLHWLLLVAIALGVAACASIRRPEGGPKDEEPPFFVSSNPAQGSLNVNKQKLDLYFNENIKLDDAFNKVIVSPAQKSPAAISANGKHVTVELKDSLLPNTTYTIDFGDAIKDLNEGNLLDGFTYAFATGDTIDTLRISGMVLEAKTLEPAQGMLVGIYSNLSDTAISTLPLERIARTNQYGQFTIYNVKEGDYRIFALNDLNRDFHWDRSEDVAFYDVTVSPWVERIEVVDTLRAYNGSDSLSTRTGYAYYPNDILLSWFNEDYKPQYLTDYGRPARNRITLKMNVRSDTLPDISIAKGPLEGRKIDDWALLRKNPTLDTLEYWINDSAVLTTDSLFLSVRYLKTDTAEMLSWTADTLRFFFRDPKPTKEEKKKKEQEEADSVAPQPVFITFRPVTSSSHDVYNPLIFEASQPIASIDSLGYRLEMAVDTLWEPVKAVFEVDSINPLLRRTINYKWKPEQKYRLLVDSAAVMGIYGQWNNAVKHEFTVRSLEEYSNLSFFIQGLDTLPAVVELLDKSDKPIATTTVENGKAEFKYLAPGTVYARLFIDKNENGKWDTGKLLDWTQPEEVYYFPKKLNLRKNWDVNQDWNIYEVTVDMQKPWDVKKNRPKLKAGEKSPEESEEEEEDDEFGSNAFGNNVGGRNGTRNTGLGGNQNTSRQFGR